MTLSFRAAAPLIASAAMVAATMAIPASLAPAQADPNTDAFLSALQHYGVVGGIDPATAVQVGQSVCPLLAEPGQNVANVAAQVADTLGRPLGPATMFTGLAIQIFCPRAVNALTDGRPFSFFG